MYLSYHQEMHHRLSITLIVIKLWQIEINKIELENRPNRTYHLKAEGQGRQYKDVRVHHDIELNNII